MTDWQRKIQLGDVWESGDVQLIAKTTADRLETLQPLTFPVLEKRKKVLIKRLRRLENSPAATPKDFDVVWEQLYDWADAPLDERWNGKKVCWIDLWSSPSAKSINPPFDCTFDPQDNGNQPS